MEVSGYKGNPEYNFVYITLYSTILVICPSMGMTRSRNQCGEGKGQLYSVSEHMAHFGFILEYYFLYNGSFGENGMWWSLKLM